MKSYLDLCERVLLFGEERPDRTGTGTLSLFGEQIKIDLRDGFPLLTTKKVFWKGVVEELLWFLRGESNVKSLNAKGVKIWNDWAKPGGELGPIYGVQWRSWIGPNNDEYDQIRTLIYNIISDPFSRRHVVSTWAVHELDAMALAPCHILFQFYVSKQTGGISCHLYQRSCDVFLGLPFNIASYALLTHMIGYLTDRQPERLTISFGDVHIYNNHVEQVREQMSRNPRPLPTLHINPIRTILDPKEFRFEDFELKGYDPHPAIKGEISV